MIEKELKTISKQVSQAIRTFNINGQIQAVNVQDNIETEARMVIPVPLPCGGVVVVGQETILYNGYVDHCNSIA